MTIKIKGMEDLFKEVIEPGLCTICGACVGDCPYLTFYRGRIRMTDFCNRTEGHCYEYCPRTPSDLDELSRTVFGTSYSGDEIGFHRNIVMAQATNKTIKSKAQYGGTITALLSFALKKGIIQSALVEYTDDNKLPKGMQAISSQDLLKSTGSNYMAYPALEALNHITKDSKEKLGIVLTPCQCLALAKMRTYPSARRIEMNNIGIVLGLFCTWALDHGRFYDFLKEKTDVPKIRKFDIPPPPANRFDIYYDKKIQSFSLDEVRNSRMPTCAYCIDMTAEFADISVGAVESIEGWNTVIIRSKRGALLFDQAKKQGIIETDSLPPEILEHLKESSMFKKSRGLKECIKYTGDRDNLFYLKMDDKIKNKLLAFPG